MATGSYEGSLSMEGASDHLQSLVFTGRRRRWSRRVPHSSDPHALTRKHKGTREEFESTHEGDVSAKRKRGSRQRCQRSHPIERRGSNRPTLVTGIREDEGTRTTRSEGRVKMRPKRFGRRENARSLEHAT
jgi:hypothetical protein